MAQPKVTNFFASRKKNSGIQPSKRLKVQQQVSTDSIIDSKLDFNPETLIKHATHETKSIQKSTSRSKRQVSAEKSHPVIRTSLRTTRSSSRSSSPAERVECKAPEREVKKVDISQTDGNIYDISDIPTAACDDHHVSPLSSPSKRTSAKNMTVGGKRSKNVQSVRKDLLPAMQPEDRASGYDFSKFLPKDTAALKGKVVRKRLVMKRRNCSDEKSVPDPEGHAEVVDTNEKQKEPVEKISIKQTLDKKTISDKMSLIHDPEAVRSLLTKSGKLAELQERLSKFSKAAAKVKESKDVHRLADLKSEKEKANEAEKPKVAPAYERYRSLAEAIPAGLNLPYKYKLLLDVFHGVDTVVSMLHKRAEVCTFNKLKNAVQLMTRKTFQDKNLAQIKSVFPEAFTFRQEKGIPIPGTGIVSNWQLTVEANLNDGGNSTDCPLDNDGRPAFTATKLLERKSLFHRLLIDITKKYHNEYLAKLDRPLTVPDEKVARWHPRFRVDQVPEINPAQLPQPPDVKKFTTAAQVLEEAHNKNEVLNARVQKALENVAKQKQAEELRAAAKKTKQTTEKVPPAKSSGDNVVKGIPQGLLERIRAKEAEKSVRSMMMAPADERRKEQISRLPDIVRIIRTYFVVYKKTCLLMEEAIKKVSTSAKSSMGEVAAEAHIKLLLELVPEWVSVVTVRKGSYLKIDRNQDLTTVINKLNTAMKQIT